MASYPEILLHIDGEWTKGAGGKSEPVLNPATGEPIGQEIGRAHV